MEITTCSAKQFRVPARRLHSVWHPAHTFSPLSPTLSDFALPPVDPWRTAVAEAAAGIYYTFQEYPTPGAVLAPPFRDAPLAVGPDTRVVLLDEDAVVRVRGEVDSQRRLRALKLIARAQYAVTHVTDKIIFTRTFISEMHSSSKCNTRQNRL